MFADLVPENKGLSQITSFVLKTRYFWSKGNGHLIFLQANGNIWDSRSWKFY